MKRLFELIDLKNLALTLIIFMSLILILVIFFIIPTNKQIQYTRHEINRLKQKLEVHNNLLPIYIQFKSKLDQLNKNIELKSTKISLMEFKDKVLNISPQFNLNVLSVYPELKKRLVENNYITLNIVLNGKYIDFIKWINLLIKEGYVSEVNSINIESDIKKLNINLKVKIKV